MRFENDHRFPFSGRPEKEPAWTGTPSGRPLNGRRRVLSVLALLLASGCAATHVRQPLPAALSANTNEAQGEFWYQLAHQPIATNDETFHSLLLYLDSKDTSASYADRVAVLKARHMLPAGFNGAGDEPVSRGNLAVALDQILKIRGGLTMRVLGPTPRYALRAAVEQGILPPSSPNQGLSGGELVGVMQKAEEYEHGNPADGPAALLPADVHHVAMLDEDAVKLAELAGVTPIDRSAPVMYMDDAPATKHLIAIVTAIQGDLVDIRSGPDAAWQHAKPGLVMHEGTEIRTGPHSAIRFLIPADEAFCLDSQGSITLQQAVIDLNKAKTRIGLEHGRLREDLSHTKPVQIEEAGLTHDTVIQSPDSALALRGTKVSLFEQPSFAPVAVSLTGQATFTNTNGIRVPVGGTRHAVIIGNQTSAAQESNSQQASAVSNGNTERLEFDTRELSIVSQRGGFVRGDVVVGDLGIADFGFRSPNVHNLPGGLDFVLSWGDLLEQSSTGKLATSLADLNLAVFSPLNSTTSPDYVANPPFTVSLAPTLPQNKKIRNTTYPQKSRSGGQLSLNSVGPEGLELAFWPKTNYPTGTYTIGVYNLVDATNPPTTTTGQPVQYTVTAYQNGIAQSKQTGSISQFQTNFFSFNIPFPPVDTTGLARKHKAVNLISSKSTIHRKHIGQ